MGSRERDEMIRRSALTLDEALAGFWPPKETPRELVARDARARDAIGGLGALQWEKWQDEDIRRAYEVADEVVSGIVLRAAQDKARAFRSVTRWSKIVEARERLRRRESGTQTEALLRVFGQRLVRALMDCSYYPIIGDDAFTSELMRHWDVEIDFVHDWPDYFFRAIAIKRDDPAKS